MGEILDDAQGYGYRTIQKAHAAWTYKSKSKKEHKEAIEKHKSIWKWLKENKEILFFLDDESFYAAKEGRPFGVKDLRKALEGWNGELKFEPKEIMSAWRKGEYIKSMKKKDDLKLYYYVLILERKIKK